MHTKEGYTNILVVGGGALGLHLADQLTATGRSVVLLDKHAPLASGSSTRNARTLRFGHTDALRIGNQNIAVREAVRAKEGFERTSRIAPGALRLGGETLIPIYETTDMSRTAERLEAAGLDYPERTPQQVRTNYPGLDTTELVSAISIPDQGIDTRQVYKELIRRAVSQGAIILPGSHITEKIDDQQYAIQVGEESMRLSADAVVVAAGYGAESVFQTLTNSDEKLGLQMGQAPVLSTRGVINATLLPIDDDRPSVTSYGDINLFTQNDLTTPVDEPQFVVDPATELALIEAASNLVPGVNDQEKNIHACFTVNAREVQGTYRVPEWDIVFTDETTLFAWPGMMTKSPVMAEQIVAELDSRDFNRSDGVSMPNSIPQTSVDVAQYPYANVLVRT